VSERQVNQETVTVIQPAEDKCRNKEMKDGRRYIAMNVSQLTQGGKAASPLSSSIVLYAELDAEHDQ